MIDPPSLLHSVLLLISTTAQSLVSVWDILLKEFIQSSGHQGEIFWCWDITRGNENPEFVTLHEVTQSLSSSTNWVWSKQAKEKNESHQQDKKLFHVIGVYCITGEVAINVTLKSDFKRGEGGKKNQLAEAWRRGAAGCEWVEVVKDGGGGVRKELYQRTPPRALPH